MAGKPKPTRLKVIEGNPGKRPLPKNEPKPKPKMPQCPLHLDSEAKKEWNRINEEIFKLGLLTNVDMVALANYCQAYSRLIAVQKALKGASLLITDIFVDGAGVEHEKVKAHPLLAQERQLMQAIRLYCTEFGFTPSSRSRISVDNSDEDDEFEKLLSK